MTAREFFEVFENIPAVQNLTDFWWGTEWWAQMQQMQVDEQTLTTQTVILMSAVEPTTNDYRYVISAVAGLIVVGSVVCMVKKRKVVDDGFSQI